MNEEELRERYDNLNYEYFDYWNTDINRAIAMVEEAMDIAKQLDEPLMMMEQRHWLAQALVFKQRDFAKAMPVVIESAVEARKPIYKEWRTRICLYQDLIAAHVGSDALSHEATIEKALAQMEEEAPPHSQCRRCLAGERFEFEMERGNLDAARQSLQNRLSIAWTGHHKANALIDQARINFLDGDFAAMVESAAAAYKLAENSHQDEDIAVDALLYQAVGYLKQGDDEQAQTFFGRYTAQDDLLETLYDNTHFKMLIAYHLGRNDEKSALQAQRNYIAALDGKGALRSEAEARLQLCELLKQTDALTDAEIAATRTAISKLKVDGGLLKKLNQLISE